jgi:hypothetical protein
MPTKTDESRRRTQALSGLIFGVVIGNTIKNLVKFFFRDDAHLPEQLIPLAKVFNKAVFHAVNHGLLLMGFS